MLLVVGALLVPVGTLLVTTGKFVPQTTQTGVVAIPSGSDNSNLLKVDLNHTHLEKGLGTFTTFETLTDWDDFLPVVVDIFKGTVIAQGGFLSTSNEVLAPLSTPNITYQTGMRYNGIVTYSWEVECLKAEEVGFTIMESDMTGPIINFTFPDGTIRTSYAGGPSFSLVMWIDPETKGTNMTPIYFALTALMEETKDFPADGSAYIVSSKGVWLLTVKCLSHLHWDVSSCLWSGSAMSSCMTAPGQNTTELDNEGLDMLNWYMSAIPWALYLQDDLLYNFPIVATDLIYNLQNTDIFALFRPPTLDDYRNLFGLVARSIAVVTFSGWYGVATVPTVGQPPKPVYVVRTYILALLVVMLCSVALLVTLDFLYHWRRHLPWRKTTFLTIAGAVRGQWWDKTLQGGSVLLEKELRERYTERVMFGVDKENSEVVGFGPNVERMRRGDVEEMKKWKT